ncbi:unnamed protein product, partial [Oncorhynchus mykiss]
RKRVVFWVNMCAVRWSELPTGFTLIFSPNHVKPSLSSPQNESERLQGQLASLRSQQSRDAEKHHLLVTSLNEQLKGLSDTQECLETSLIEKENTLVKTSEKLELIDSLRDSFMEKEAQHKEVADKLLQSENNLTEVSTKCSTFEKQCSELKTSVADLTHKLSVLKEKTQKQEATINTLQNDLDQTNDELDKLNTTHLEERSQLIHNLQSCEREIDNLRDVLSDKDKEILALSGNMAEYAEQIMVLKQEIKHKEEDLVRIETALTKSEREAEIIKDSQNSDQQALTAELVEQLKDAETELSKAKEEKESRTVEVEELRKQVEEDKRTILELRGEIQQHNTLKDQLQDKEQTYEKELKSVKEERNKLNAEVSKHNDDLKTLSNQLEKQTECQVQLKKDMQEKLETISSLEEKLRAIQEEAEKLLKNMKTEKQQLQADLKEKADELKDSLRNKVSDFETQHSENRKVIEGLLKDKEELSVRANELNRFVTDQNSQVETQQSQLSQLQETMYLLQEQETALKTGLTEKDTCLEEKEETFRQMTQDCENHKAELNKRNESLKSLSSQLGVMNESSAKLESENTELKTTLENHGAENNKLRHEMEQRQAEALAHSQDQVDSLNTQLDQLNNNITEKEKTIRNQNSQLEAQQRELSQLQETLALLQEQGTALKSGLSEKDTMLQQKAEEEEMEQRQTEILDLRDNIQALNEQNVRLKTELKNSVTEASKKLEEISQLTAACSDRDSLGLNLQQRGESLKQQEMFIKQLQTKLEEQEAQLKQKVDDYVSLRTYVSELEDSTTQLRGQVDSLTSESSLLKETLKEKVKFILEAQSTSSAVSESLNSKLKTKDTECESLKEQLSHLQESSVSKLNSSLSAQSSEVARLQQALEERGTAVKDQSKALQELQRRADEAALFKTQFMESTELVSQLQDQIQELSTKSASLSQSAEENQSAFVNLQEKYATHLEELQEARTMLSQRAEEMSSLNKSLSESNSTVQAAESTIEVLRNESSLLRQDLRQIQTLNVDLSKQKEDALATHQRSTSTFTEIALSKQENQQRLDAAISEKERLQQEVQKLIIERDEHGKSYSSQIQTMQEQLQVEVSVKGEEITGLKSDIQKIGQTLQDSEKEWLSVLDRETQDKYLIAEQLKSVENEMKSKDFKVQALKQDLDSLHEKLAEAATAIRQENIQHLHAQLQTETENLREAGIKQTALLSDIQTKDEQVSCMTIQISHQKELLAGLSQQLREKDASVAQVIESASNERMKYAEENSNFLSQLESLENAQSSSMKQLEHIKAHLSRSQSELETKDLENGDLVKEKDHLNTQLTKLTKEKEVLKKKLQAALVVRKELLKKIEEHEHQIEQNVNKGIEISGLQDRLQELTLQAQATTKEHEDIVLTVRDSLLEHFEINMQTLQAKLDEQEASLTTALHNLNEKIIIIDQLNSIISEKDEAFEQEKSGMMLRLEKLQEDMRKSEESLKEDMSSSSATAVDIENELTKVKQEKAMMQKKAQAALLARKETIKKFQESEKKFTQELSELKDDYKALLEQHCQQTNDLNAVQLSELETLRLLVQERDKTLQDLNISLSERESQLARQQQAVEMAEQLHQQEKQTMVDDHLVLQNQLGPLQTTVEELKHTLEALVESQAEMESLKLHMESLQQEKESAFMVIEQLNCEVAMLDAQLKEAGKERDDALVISQSLATEKEELIAALEQQLQRQIHLHEVAMEKMRTEVDELQQRSQEDAIKTKDQGNQSKTALLTRKLQAALVSRKEILKDNSSLKEQMRILSAKNEEIGASSTVLEMSVAKLKQQKEDLESSVSSLSREKEKLIAEVDRILNDNHNLSAACESLKLTIENITQQKQAFSCQLESLKDSQTDELSEWKSKHTELKQEYERERQEALVKAHKSEAERENLEKQKIKEKMRKFTKAKQLKMEELEEENKQIRIDLLEFDDKQKATVEELTIKNNHLEAEIHSLVESSEALRRKLTEIQLNNGSLAEALKEATCSLEKWPTESKACEQNMQLKLDDALILNNSLTAQIESQKTELASQQEINKLTQKGKETLSERIKQMQNKHEKELGEKDDAISELQEMINRHSQETTSLNEKSILQEELENVQEISDKVKNENEYLEIVILKNAERIDELTETVNVLQAQNTQFSSQLTESKEKATQVCQEKEEQQLKLVKEFEEKLKMFQRGNEGSRNIKKELQELLKEKHHEINHLQHDSIKYQELILDLERSLKASESAHEQVEKELREMTERISCLEEGRRHLEAELTTHKNLLNEAKKDLTNISSEKDQLVEVVSEKNNQSECQVTERTKALQHVAEQQKSIFMEREVILQQHIEELLGSKEKEIAATAQQRQLFIMGASNRELNETVELLNQQLQELSDQVERLEQDRSALNRHLTGSVDSTSKMKSQLLLSQSHSDMLQVDFEKQEAISLHLKSLLQNKDAEISSLLSSRDGQMSGYLEQLQANHRAQVEGYEDRLSALYYEREKADKEFRRLENKVKSLQMKVDKSIQEKEKMAAQMETFRNSMVSLQTERERLMSEYRMSEARNQTVMQGKEGSAEGDLSATKGLKHEIRTLLHQMDDLNSENAMLRAQLIRYREDLNQVLSLKDSQLKELLRKQQDAIKNLENQKATAEKQNRKTLLELERKGEASDALKAENSKLQTQVTDLEANILALNKGMQETNKGKDKYNSELDAFEQEVELMRNEKETADQRVAELARDLMQTEKLLSDARSQNESLGKAMAALQNDRDQLIEDFKILRNRYDEELRETQGAMTKLATLAKERHILVQKLSALESKDAPSQLTSLVDELSVALSEKEGQLQRVSLENDTYSSKVSAFSRSMASLQDDRDRLMEELAGAKRAFESRQGLGPEVVDIANTGESNSHRSSGIQALQTGRDGLVSHQFVQMSLLNVRCCCVSSGMFCLLKETRQRVDELQSALQQAQAFKLQTEAEVSGPHGDTSLDLSLKPTVWRGVWPHGDTSQTSHLSESSRLQAECQRLAGERKETMALVGKDVSDDPSLTQLQAERTQLQSHLQRCLYEIQQRDLHCQQLNAKLQQVVEEKGGVSAQLRAVSQTLRDTQNRCYWLENQALPNQHHQGLAKQGAVSVEVPPGAPQERSSAVVDMEALEAGELRTR